ncbi:hypothetical protein KP509_1Z031500 [Ceratopteris richardii]|nr:hypothetical protein KP509_1Z031500 [Ceratopteris richardii]
MHFTSYPFLCISWKRICPCNIFVIFESALRQVPPVVSEKNSPAWNGGSVWLHGERPKVMKAFASQYRKVMRCFFPAQLNCIPLELCTTHVMTFGQASLSQLGRIWFFRG